MMDDSVSRESVDSSSTSDEFVVVNADPKFKLTGDMSDIHKEITDPAATNGNTKMATSITDNNLGHVIPNSQSADVLLPEGSVENKSYLENDIIQQGQSSSELQQKCNRSTSLPSFPSGDCTVFNGVTYLGCAIVNAPRSEVEIYRNMAIMNDQTQLAIPIILSVPSTSEGVISPTDASVVRLIDPSSDSEIASYRIHRILFCARGPADSNEKKCFAFTFSYGDTAESAIFQCHVFRCDLAEAVPKILYCFATTFRRVPRSTRTISTSSLQEAEQNHVFTVGIEFKEDDGKGSYTACPKDKNIFKFKCNIEKRIVISVQQTGLSDLKIERCFGLLISPGRNVKHSDMQLIELVSMGYQSDGRSYTISGHWDPTEQCFAVLNTETPKDTRVFLTVAVDLVIFGIQEPVRFAIESKAKIFSQTERFWYFSTKPHYEQFYVRLKQIDGNESEDGLFEVLSVDSQTELERRSGLTLSLNPNRAIPDPVQTPQDIDEESDGDEPLLSGSGVVSKEITDENLLDAWHDVLTKWHQNLSQRPKQVHHLVRKGVPEALRGEVWQLLAGVHEGNDSYETYRILISKESDHESVIQRDINRTFPAHDFFKDAGGSGQDSLYKISKAYAVYDEEISYVQGLSFLAAALLLHMPEEQAFSVLVKIMYDYGLRSLFKPGFEELHLKFYQLERLIQDQIPDLFCHFAEMCLEVHMFASQWFLTLFTAKFPLNVVFHILDLYLSEGKDVIFNVALALLKCSRKHLLALDFEGVLKYFRVQLPKRFRSEEAETELIQTAILTKVTARKLKKYEKEYITMKEQEEDPTERYERENKRLLEANMRLEQENDDLAHELVESKLALRSELDSVEDTNEILTQDLMVTKKALKETEEEKRRLEYESSQLKEMCRRELDRAEAEGSRNTLIIADYKQICSQLSERLEKQQTAAKEELQRIRVTVKACDDCSKLIDKDGKVKLPDPIINPADQNPIIIDLKRQVRELELELAQTKLALVESECKTQDLTHQLNSAITEIQASKNTWFNKTINSIREVAQTKKDLKDVKEG
ncbi:rab GTPase-activating protein 1 isoform X1 [Patella vulgata]|uniref:rab GTPase-activating protein 1 isoform X1 n=1 Tax=Patella vulgata TaxID=6465 RepID=UPI00217FBF8F|nr:rab GTPase-activating protein 1 isoform X1 [Patella vulgata]XP_050389745.1 rab GTPase-activating protein 1 isoform X1 [Patella vulgata]